MKRKKRKQRGWFQTRDVVILGLGVGLIWALTRKPIETSSKLRVDWTSQARKDYEALFGRKS